MAINDDMKLAAAYCLDYFATSYRTESSKKRRDFAENAGLWLEEAVKKLGKNRIVRTYTFEEEEMDSRQELFGLASAALHSKAGWTKREKALKKDMKESLQLAKDLDSLYSEGNKMLYAVLKREATTAGGEIDGEYLDSAIGELYTAIQDVLDWSNNAWAEHINKQESKYSMVNPDIHEVLEGYRKKLGERACTAAATFAVGLGFCEPGIQKVTKEKLKSLVDERRQEILDGAAAPGDCAQSYKTQNTGYHG